MGTNGDKEYHVLDIPENELVAEASIEVTDLDLGPTQMIELVVDESYSSSDPLIIIE